MIGRLTGNLALVEGNLLLLDVAGVGYEVQVSASVLASSLQIGASMTLFTHFVAREEAQLLFGFADQGERDLFRTFIRINGVGPKMALALISTINPATLVSAVQANEVGVLTKVPGVGRKTAERLIVELKSRRDNLMPDGDLSVVSAVGSADSVACRDAEDALIALGYKPDQAAEAVHRAQQALADTPAGTEQLVTWVLRRMGRAS